MHKPTSPCPCIFLYITCFPLLHFNCSQINQVGCAQTLFSSFFGSFSLRPGLVLEPLLTYHLTGRLKVPALALASHSLPAVATISTQMAHLMPLGTQQQCLKQTQIETDAAFQEHIWLHLLLSVCSFSFHFSFFCLPLREESEKGKRERDAKKQNAGEKREGRR